jgi:hypothetical protein
LSEDDVLFFGLDRTGHVWRDLVAHNSIPYRLQRCLLRSRAASITDGAARA